jgi:4-hydroxy-tetrahydrodipicolinate synthase
MARLGSLLTATVTPMRADGGIDLPGAEALFDHILRTGSDGLVVCGTTGESPTLSDDERLELFRVAVSVARGHDATVIAGTGTYDTAHSVHLSEEAGRIGCDGVLAVTPYYSKPPLRGIRAHFEAIAEAGLPVILYNIPSRVVLELPPDFLGEMAEVDGIVAVKQAISDLATFDEVVAATGGRLDVYAGNDDVLVPFALRGAVGGVCVVSQVAGELTSAALRAALDGREDEARRLDAQLRPLLDALAVTTNPIPVKAALDLLGLPAGPLRLPLVEATGDEREVIRQALEGVGAASAAGR